VGGGGGDIYPVEAQTKLQRTPISAWSHPQGFKILKKEMLTPALLTLTIHVWGCAQSTGCNTDQATRTTLTEKKLPFCRQHGRQKRGEGVPCGAQVLKLRPPTPLPHTPVFSYDRSYNGCI